MKQPHPASLTQGPKDFLQSRDQGGSRQSRMQRSKMMAESEEQEQKYRHTFMIWYQEMVEHQEMLTDKYRRDAAALAACRPRPTRTDPADRSLIPSPRWRNAMRLSRPRFTILTLMIVVVIASLVLTAIAVYRHRIRLDDRPANPPRPITRMPSSPARSPRSPSSNTRRAFSSTIVMPSKASSPWPSWISSAPGFVGLRREEGQAPCQVPPSRN